MKLMLVILSTLIARFHCAPFDAATLIFVGSSFSDYKTFNVSSNFNEISGTKYFNASKESVLIIHGYTDGYSDGFASTLVNAFLTRPNFNIIFANWEIYAAGPDYPAVVGSLSHVSDIYIELLNRIKSTGYDLTKIYVVGHSLGAHLAGRIGNSLKSQGSFLPRITGLDPAGPLFFPPTSVTILGGTVTIPGNMLSKGSAGFVDIIHTSAGAAGTLFPTGNIDFWPNGGGAQPMCTGLSATKYAQCNHSAAWKYYSESVLSASANFISKRCRNGVTLYGSAGCNGPATASMGFYANSNSQPGNYFVATKATSPYSN